MTVIRLVNDAVDNIESEGMKEYLLSTPRSLLCLSSDAKVFVQLCISLRYNVLNAAEPPLFHSLSIQDKTSCLDFQYFCQFLTLDLCVFQFLPFGFLCCLSEPLSDVGFLSPFVVSNMDKEQRRSSPGE